MGTVKLAFVERAGTRDRDLSSSQADAKVFKKYSQMKLQMKRDALTKLNHRANETAAVGF